MSYSQGSMSTQELKDLFGDSLQVRDDGHVTFSNDGDTDKFMNDSKLRDVFTGAMGRDAGDWDDGVSSENDLGTVVRYLSDGGDKPKEEKEEPYKESKHLKTAKERVNKWETRFNEDGDDTWASDFKSSDPKKMNNQADNAEHYLDNYKLTLRQKNKDKGNSEAM